MNKLRKPMLILAACCFFTLPVLAQPDGGPGGGGGPGDPPRDTPGLAPYILTGMATAGYLGYQALKNSRLLRKQK